MLLFRTCAFLSNACEEVARRCARLRRPFKRRRQSSTASPPFMDGCWLTVRNAHPVDGVADGASRTLVPTLTPNRSTYI